MPRRTATMLAATLILIALLSAGVLIQVPYAEMSPGPTVNTLGKHRGESVLQISGHKTYATQGNLNMTTVSVTSADYRMNLIEAVYGWLDDDRLVVPHQALYPDGQTEEQSNQQNAEEFSQSEESAKVAALRQLKIPVKTWVVVGSVLKGGAAQGRLHAGDVIRSVDDIPVHQPDDVAKLVTKHKPGEEVTFTVTPAQEWARSEKSGKLSTRTKDVTITTRKADDSSRAIVGIQPGVDHTFPFPIDINLADVGGPSAGLMFSLGLVDKLTPAPLTGGEFVAGTGTIDDSGVVGRIGGIEMKMIGAHNAGAKYFLTPEGNCAVAARNAPPGLTLIKVGTLGDALRAMEDLHQGMTQKLPRCGKG